MTKMPWVRFFPSDWLGGTRGMSAVETGIYITLIATMYERGEPIVEDHARLARLCGASNSAFKKALDTLIDEGKITRIEAGLWNDRVEKEQVYVSERIDGARRAGRASAVSRHEKHAELRRLRMQAAKLKANHTDLEWAALFAACGSRCVKCGATEQIERDHIVPVYQGGSDGIYNLQPLCRSCNAGKGPENSDLRPANWRGRFEAVLCEMHPKDKQNQSNNSSNVDRQSNDGSTNQKPDTRYISTDVDIKETRTRDFTSEFESHFWPIYPNKVGKPVARTAFIKARAKVDLETIMAGLRAYVSKTDDRAWCNPSTWLNQERWADAPAQVPRGHAPPGGQQPAMMADLTGALLRQMTDRQNDEPDSENRSTIETSYSGGNNGTSAPAFRLTAPEGRR
nr:DUF1376 domain-containing protein [Brucella intermedia]